MKNKKAWEVSNWYSVQYNSFSKVKTPDDGQVGPKHILKNGRKYYCVQSVVKQQDA
jgi:hypothetical protein